MERCVDRKARRHLLDFVQVLATANDVDVHLRAALTLSMLLVLCQQRQQLEVPFGPNGLAQEVRALYMYTERVMALVARCRYAPSNH
jgi:hypothetical protein